MAAEATRGETTRDLDRVIDQRERLTDDIEHDQVDEQQRLEETAAAWNLRAPTRRDSRLADPQVDPVSEGSHGPVRGRGIDL